MCSPWKLFPEQRLFGRVSFELIPWKLGVKYGLLLVDSFETKLSNSFYLFGEKIFGKVYYWFIIDRLCKINILKCWQDVSHSINIEWQKYNYHTCISSVSFQNKLEQQQFRKTCRYSVLLPFCCHCVCFSFSFKMSALAVSVHICWQKSLKVKFGFPWVKELVSCMRSRLCLQSCLFLLI